MSNNKFRATIDEEGVGMERYLLFKEGYRRISDAIQHAYYLEAITLIESMLADRLESRCGELTNQPQHFQMLGNLISGLRKVEHDDLLNKIMKQEIDSWREDRNHAVHEMMKIQSGKSDNWLTRQRKLKKIASAGLKTLRKYDSKLKKVRRSNAANDLSSELS